MRWFWFNFVKYFFCVIDTYFNFILFVQRYSLKLWVSFGSRSFWIDATSGLIKTCIVTMANVDFISLWSIVHLCWFDKENAFNQLKIFRVLTKVNHLLEQHVWELHSFFEVRLLCTFQGLKSYKQNSYDLLFFLSTILNKF